MAHRLEFVREWNGAKWYNDSIATAPERTMAAIRSFTEPIVLLLGGRDKNLPWEELAALVHATCGAGGTFRRGSRENHCSTGAGSWSTPENSRTLQEPGRGCSGRSPHEPNQARLSCFHRAAPVLINSVILKNVERLFENGYRNFRKTIHPTCGS